MEGEIKQNHSCGMEGEADTLPGRIHEYDFFLTRNGEGGGKSPSKDEEEDRPETAEGKKERNKSSLFFLPE